MRTFILRGLFLTTVFVLLGSLAIHAAGDGLITEQITVRLDEAGTLPDKISESEKYQITNLKIIGDINGTDLRMIREMAGRDCQCQETNGKLSILNLSEAHIVSGGDYYCEYYSDRCFSEDNKIGDRAFESCSSLTVVNLPSDITEIGWATFSNCSNLGSIGIPESVIKIDGLAFAHCNSLREVSLPDGLTSLGSCCFYECSSLYSIIIPKGVTSLEASCFRDCI